MELKLRKCRLDALEDPDCYNGSTVFGLCRCNASSIIVTEVTAQ